MLVKTVPQDKIEEVWPGDMVIRRFDLIALARENNIPDSQLDYFLRGIKVALDQSCINILPVLVEKLGQT